MKKAYIYMIRCEDSSLYTGIAADLEKRLKQHYHRQKGCAKYTKAHRMQKVEAVFTAADLQIAAKLEYRIKRLSRAQKEHLIVAPSRVYELTGHKLDDYTFGTFSEQEIENINQAVCI